MMSRHSITLWMPVCLLVCAFVGILLWEGGAPREQRVSAPKATAELYAVPMSSSCRREALRSLFRRHPASVWPRRSYVVMARRLVACRDWHGFFTWLLPVAQKQPWFSSDARGHLFDRLVADGADVIAGLSGWIEQKNHWKRFDPASSAHPVWHSPQRDAEVAKGIFRWLVTQPRPRRVCAALVKGYPGWTSPIQREVMAAVAVIRCDSWHRLLRKALHHPNPHNRKTACQLLARYGGILDVRAISLLAVADMSSIQRGAQVSYPVRQACSDARRKLLRAHDVRRRQ